MAERIIIGRAQIENLISILAHDDEHGKIVSQLIEPQIFEGVYRNIAERLVLYWKSYQKAPKLHTADLFADILDEKDSRLAVQYKRVLRNMQTLFDGINTNYVITTLTKAARRQRMKIALLKAAEIAQQENMDLDEGERVLADFVRAREFHFDRGMRLTDTDRVIDFMRTHFAEFSTGIRELDRAHVVPARGAVHMLIAPTRRGKSWWLGHLGKHALLQRKRVLHVTMEMPEEEVLQRYYQAIFAIPKRDDQDDKILLRDIDVDQRGYFRKTSKPEIYKPAVTFEYKKIKSVLNKKLSTWVERKIANKLVVKRFPPRRLTMDMLRSFIDTLEASDGWTPDMIVLDYIGITNTDPKNPRISLGRNMEEFRALCIEYNAAGVTAQQGSRASEDAYQVKITHVQEDWSLIGTVDACLTFSQTDAERDRGLARLWVDKCRGEKDNWGMVITQNYQLGQFVLQSARLGTAYHKMIARLSGEDKRAKEESDDE